MMTAGSRFFRVVVRRNLVCEIRSIDASEARCSEDDPLIVSTQLAQNNRNNGCLDGEYDFASFEAARHFATLCAGYLQSFCEKSVEAMNRLDRPEGGTWFNPYIPQPPSSGDQD
jgi:hypothetical protein